MTGPSQRALQTLHQRREEETQQARLKVEQVCIELEQAQNVLKMSRSALEAARAAAPACAQSYQDVRSLQRADLSLQRHRTQLERLEEVFNQDNACCQARGQKLKHAQHELRTTRALARAVDSKLQSLAQYAQRKKHQREQEAEDEAVLLKRLRYSDDSFDSP